MDSTIVALSTPPGAGAIGVIRLSGADAIRIVDAVFRSRKRLSEQPSHTLHFGRIVEADGRQKTKEGSGEEAGNLHDESTIDEVVVSLFRAPNSYTGEDVAEISCHGSPYVLRRVLEICVQGGATPAAPGEFTRRAFLNGKIDLTQAEAVGDLIAAESRAAQQTAMHQLRGGFSSELKAMREELITFSALIELELDFSGEDVMFADRAQLYDLLQRIDASTSQLIASFSLGNALKNGVRIAIVGAPNAGKSTLLNALLNEDRAIVSEIAGTTRDTIEEVVNIGGILFRFIDTAGIREHTADAIERQGIARSLSNAAGADIVIHLVDMMAPADDAPGGLLAPFSGKTITVGNKMDRWKERTNAADVATDEAVGIYITARTGEGLEELRGELLRRVSAHKVAPGNTIITNTRHLAALQKIAVAVADIKAGLDGDIPGDLIALDIRQALHYIGEITGQVVHDRDVLGAVFGKFCIGK